MDRNLENNFIVITVYDEHLRFDMWIDIEPDLESPSCPILSQPGYKIQTKN